MAKPQFSDLLYLCNAHSALYSNPYQKHNTQNDKDTNEFDRKQFYFTGDVSCIFLSFVKPFQYHKYVNQVIAQIKHII